jgi:hypothetical protein
VILLLLALDIAPEPLTTGGTNLAAKGKPLTVEMLAEEVDLHPSADRNRVAAVFRMKNTGAEDVEIEVGFPSYFEVRLRDFEAAVAGRKVAAEVKRQDLGGPKKVFIEWMCWTAKFPAGQEVEIKVSYWCPTERVFPELWVDNLPADLKSKLWACRSGYVLRTGAGWAGKIGKATIRLHGLRRDLVTRLEPEGWNHDEKVSTLTLTDFEPDESSDAVYEFRLCTVAEEAELLTAALREKKLDPWAQERLLGIVAKDKVPEVLEWMVPPRGPGVDQSKISRGAENVVRQAYARLLRHYGEEKKALPVARSFEGFLKFMLERDAKWKGSSGYAGREYAALERQYEETRALIRRLEK